MLASGMARSRRFLDLSVDLHGVKTPAETTSGLIKSLGAHVLREAAAHRDMLTKGPPGIVSGDRNRKSRPQSS